VLATPKLLANASSEGTAIDDVRSGCTLDDDLQLGLEGAAVFRGALFQTRDGPFVKVPDQNSRHPITPFC